MNGLICVYKPQNMTSFDVVAKVRKQLKIRKVGHSGTLDPNAEGILLLAINRATKSLQFLNVGDKTYLASMRMGYATDTGDVWGKKTHEQAVKSFSEEQVLEVFKMFEGPMRQKVPMVSAKKYRGKKLYEYARQGQEIKARYTDIHIHRLELVSIEGDTICFRADVSNGTYIRSLVEDIAMALGNLGHMTSLLRERLGNFSLEDAIAIDEIHPKMELIPIDAHLSYPIYNREDLKKDIMHGRKIILDYPEDRVVLKAGAYVSVYERENDRLYRVVRGLW